MADMEAMTQETKGSPLRPQQDLEEHKLELGYNRMFNKIEETKGKDFHFKT